MTNRSGFRASDRPYLPISRANVTRLFFAIVVEIALLESSAFSQQHTDVAVKTARSISKDLLKEIEWRDVETAVDKGLKFLVNQQRADGAFHTDLINEPGISGLCVLAILSRGHMPHQGPYGEQLDKSVNMILDCQQTDGLICRHRNRTNSPYSHAICSIVLSEVYGMSVPEDEVRFKRCLERAIDFTSHRYSQPKKRRHDEGSWRYLEEDSGSDGDISVTSWNVMFLRSAKNAGFAVDINLIDEALAYTKRLYDTRQKAFRYQISQEDPQFRVMFNPRRALSGAGVLALSLAGEHHSMIAENSSKYILSHPFNQYSPESHNEYLCYSAFYCSQAMFQMGGEYWNEFYPRLVRTVLQAQRTDGSWISEGKEAQFGTAYSTALTVLALTPPYQILPIFQR